MPERLNEFRDRGQVLSRGKHHPPRVKREKNVCEAEGDCHLFEKQDVCQGRRPPATKSTANEFTTKEGIDQIQNILGQDDVLYVGLQGKVSSEIWVPGRHLDKEGYQPKTEEQRRAYAEIKKKLGGGMETVLWGSVLAVEEEMTEMGEGVRLIKHSTALVGAQIGNCADVVALTDTGASRSCISMAFMTKWHDALMRHGGKFVEGVQVRLAGADNKPLRTTGVVDLTLQVGPRKFRHRFIVIDGLRHDVILGCDFLRATRATIDFGKGCLTIEDSAYTFEVQADSMVAGVHLAPERDFRIFCSEEKDMVLPPGAAHIKVRLDPVPEAGAQIFVDQHLSHNGLLTAPGPLAADDGSYFLRVLNTSTLPCEVMPGAFLGVGENMEHRHCSATVLGETLWDTEAGAAGKEDVSTAIAEGQEVMSVGRSFGFARPLEGAATEQGEMDEDPRAYSKNGDWIDVDLSKSELPEEYKALYDAMIRSRYRAFAPNPEFPGKTDLVKLTIDTGDSRPIAIPPRRHPYAHDEFVRQKLQSLQKAGIIRESNSPWAAPIVVVMQKGKARFAIDYRELNKILRNHETHYPITLIDSCLDVLKDAKFFTVMDVLSAYHQMAVDEESIPKTAFVCKYGQFEYVRAPFGLKNIPGLWSRLADMIFKGLKWSIVNVFFDDICAFSKTAEDHVRDVALVLDRLIAAGLTVSPAKCKFARSETKFLGFIVSKDGIKANPEAVATVKNFPTPRNLRGVRSFIGLCSYYRRFIKGFATIAGPLNDLMCKTTRWHWNKAQAKAFDQLKQALTSAPVLAFPDLNKGYTLYTDASNYGLGAVLEQEGDDGQSHVIGYASRSLAAAEKKYSPTHKEALAVVWAVNKFRTYIYGRHVKIVTDHLALQYLHKVKDTTGQLHRWSMALQEYDHQIEFRPGLKHINADVLSRMEWTPHDTADDAFIQALEEAIMFLPDRAQPPIVPADSDNDSDDESVGAVDGHVEPRSAAEVDEYAPAWAWTADLGAAQRMDEELAERVAFIETGAVPERLTARQAVEFKKEMEAYFLRDQDKLLMFIAHTRGTPWKDAPELIVVPKQLRSVIMRTYHDGAMGGHMGFNKTLARIREKYIWTGMARDVQHHCDSCNMCHSRRNPPRRRRHDLGRRPPIWAPFQRLSCDYVSVCNSERGFDSMLVFTDSLTHWVEAFPTQGTTAKNAATLLYDKIICRYGCPKELLSDNGRHFANAVIEELTRVMGVRKSYTVPYRPQANGQVERANQTFLNMLAMFADERGSDWDLYVPSLLFAYNTSFHTAIGESPYYLMYGRSPRLPTDVIFDTPQLIYENLSDYSKQLAHRLRLAHAAAAKLNEDRRDEAFIRFAAKRGKRMAFEEGDKVWLYCPHKKKGTNYKLVRPWTGPYRVVAKLGDYVYRVEWMDGSYRKPELVHATRLKPYTARELVTPELPAPEDFQQQLHVEPEEVIPPLDRDASRQKQRYLIPQHEERPLTAEQLDLVGRYFKYGNEFFVVVSVGYDTELKANAARYRLCKKHKGIFVEKEKRQPLRRLPLEEVEELVRSFGGW